MYVCELIKPGSFICHENREYSRKFENLIGYLESSFYEANVSLNSFTDECNKIFNSNGKTYDDALAEMQRRKELAVIIRGELGLGLYDDVSFEVESRLKREKWDQGIVPTSHENCLSFIFAKSFLYTLDSIDKFIKIISEEHDSPEKIKEIHVRLNTSLPHLRGVRNSTQHLEDRARRIGAKGKKLDPKGVSNGSYKAPPGALFLSNLNGCSFGTTMADGHYGEVDVSIETLLIVRDIVQDVIYSFQWEGHRELLPR
ncbi:hypothetical protein V5027_00185 [Enterobacter bugandensis]|uniref:hypothetical protein n=1 Tax=Enterobacter bugandensis TaxID=881260 RepID=UPI00307671F9